MQYVADFLSGHEAHQLMAWMLDEGSFTWRREQFSIFGKQRWAPRKLAWCGDAGLNYRYTGLDHHAFGWLAPLGVLRAKVERESGQKFNFVLLNRYDTGQHYMGWHRDDENAAAPTIVSVSLGQTRRFRYREGSGTPSTALDLACGSMLVFDGRCQHMLAKTRLDVGVRINLTFRNIAP